VPRRGVHFYTDDYKFSALWKHPERLVRFGPAAVVEPNYSTWEEQPLAEALWGLLRKRTLAAFWQAQGLRVVVDLDLAGPVVPYALLGVPRGWPSYATRAHGDQGTAALEAQYAMAQQHSGRSDPGWIVFGGRKAVQQLCEARGWLHVPEPAQVAQARKGV
jgi:hypothetical protein